MKKFLFNKIEIPRIYSCSNILKYIGKLCTDTVIVYTDDQYSKNDIIMFENMINLKCPDLISENDIIKGIQFSEKYDIPILGEKLKKYFAKVIFPLFYDNIEKIYNIYNDPESNNILPPNHEDVKLFLKKFSIFLT